MAVMKEIGAKCMFSCCAKFQREQSNIIHGLNIFGIVNTLKLITLLWRNHMCLCIVLTTSCPLVRSGNLIQILTMERDHMIPRGLRIKTIPMVPRIDTLQQTLQDHWTTTLNKTSSALLKHLKEYHRAAIPILEEEINYLKRRLRNNADFAQNFQNIERETQQWSKICERKKRTKLARLYRERPGNGTKRRRRKRRNRKQNGWKTNDEFDPNTVVNISNVPLSDNRVPSSKNGGTIWYSMCTDPFEDFVLKSMRALTRRTKSNLSDSWYSSFSQPSHTLFCSYIHNHCYIVTSYRN